MRAPQKGKKNPLARNITERGKGGVQRYVGEQVAIMNQLYKNHVPEGELALYMHHEVDSRKSASGWPDVILLSFRNRAKVREIKADDGRVTPVQDMVIRRMRQAGIDAGYWTATDMVDGTIAREIAEMCAPDRKKQ